MNFVYIFLKLRLRLKQLLKRDLTHSDSEWVLTISTTLTGDYVIAKPRVSRDLKPQFNQKIETWWMLHDKKV